MDLSLTYCKSESFVEKAIGNEKVLVPLTDNVANMNKVYNLNEVASFIYDSLDGKITLKQVHDAIIKTYEVNSDVVINDIDHIITKMVSMGVLFVKPQ